MRICEISGKCVMHGNQISHSHRSSKRVWRPNLQPVTIMVSGAKLKIRVCTKVLKSLKGASEIEVAKILKSNAKTLSPKIAKVLAK